MTLADIKNYVYRSTQSNATSFPAADMLIEVNNARQRVESKIRKFLDNYRGADWSSGDLSTGTAEPKFDSLFHELIPLYISRDRAIEKNLPSVNGFLTRIADKERELEEWFGLRNYEVFTVTIASPGVITKNQHGLQTNDRVTLITTGAVPTGLAVDTFYFVIYVSNDTFQLSATSSGTAINTSGSQSGVHYYASDRPKRMKVGYQDNR